MKKIGVLLLIMSSVCFAQLKSDLKIYKSFKKTGNGLNDFEKVDDLLLTVHWDDKLDSEEVSDFVDKVTSNSIKSNLIKNKTTYLQSNREEFKKHIDTIIANLKEEVNKDRPALSKNLESCLESNILDNIYEEVRSDFKKRIQKKLQYLNENNLPLLSIGISEDLDLGSMTIKDLYQVGNKKLPLLSEESYEKYSKLMDSLGTSVGAHKVRELTQYIRLYPRDKANELGEFLKYSLGTQDANMRKIPKKISKTEYQMLRVRLYLDGRERNKTSFSQKMKEELSKIATEKCKIETQKKNYQAIQKAGSIEG